MPSFPHYVLWFLSLCSVAESKLMKKIEITVKTGIMYVNLAYQSTGYRYNLGLLTHSECCLLLLLPTRGGNGLFAKSDLDFIVR